MKSCRVFVLPSLFLSFSLRAPPLLPTTLLLSTRSHPSSLMKRWCMAWVQGWCPQPSHVTSLGIHHLWLSPKSHSPLQVSYTCTSHMFLGIKSTYCKCTNKINVESESLQGSLICVSLYAFVLTVFSPKEEKGMLWEQEKVHWCVGVSPTVACSAGGGHLAWRYTLITGQCHQNLWTKLFENVVSGCEAQLVTVVFVPLWS